MTNEDIFEKKFQEILRKQTWILKKTSSKITLKKRCFLKIVFKDEKDLHLGFIKENPGHKY